MKNVQIYTDGACKGNPGPGGWGAIIVYGSVERELSGGEERTTNNRMELSGAQGTLPCYAIFGFKISDRRAAEGLGGRLARTRMEEVGRQACTEPRSVGSPARADGAA